MSRLARFVFVGDSITDCERDRSDHASLGEGYVRLLADALAGYAGHPGTVRNAGVSGDRAVDLEARWAADVLAAEPDVLTIYVGVNDMWRRFDSDDPTSAEDFEATLRRLVADLPSPRPRLLFIEPFFLPTTTGRLGWLDDLDGKRAAVARVAADSGATLIALHERMSAAARELGIPAVAPDGVHPTPAGHRMIADAWLEAYGQATV
ncbi:SGNH/GDSL hydrolase family protein [Leifsonia sp. NPDC058194]|uniref:SGNH/GDSL hydrolase family protein n=1 Tax=Leifsonia sp. NPDC058194 TaxID=3346374 RepID=UPI0036D8530E